MAGHTLTLDIDTWDLQLDAAGNIMHGAGAYGIAQNVANTVRLFTDDAWYEPERGIPHFLIDLGKRPAPSLIKSYVEEAAQAVAGVQNAVLTDLDLEERVLTGDIELTTDTGAKVDVAF